MIAMTVIMGTKYDCNLGYKKGPNMTAIIKNCFREIRLEINL